MVTPIARRRPEQLARQVATLDSLSGGRVIFCAGLGGPVEDEFGSFGDTNRPRRAGRAPRRRPGPAASLLVGRASQPPGAPLPRPGCHLAARVGTTPATARLDRGFWPHRRPMRRAARWDGVVPLFTTAGHGQVPPVDQVRDLVAYIRKHREGRAELVRGRPRESARPTLPRQATRSQRWPTRVPPGGTNGNSRAATTCTDWGRCSGASTKGRPP